MIVFDRDRPPAEKRLPFLRDDAGQELLEPEARRLRAGSAGSQNSGQL